jgi:hypothetical protein
MECHDIHENIENNKLFVFWLFSKQIKVLFNTLTWKNVLIIQIKYLLTNQSTY